MKTGNGFWYKYIIGQEENKTKQTQKNQTQTKNQQNKPKQ